MKPGFFLEKTLAALAAAASTKERHRQQTPPRLIHDFQFDISGIREFVTQLFNRSNGFGTGRFEIGQLDALLVLVDVVTVADIEEKSRHGTTLEKRETARKRL